MPTDDTDGRQPVEGGLEVPGDSLEVKVCHSDEAELVCSTSAHFHAPSMTPIAERLPAEILSECLRATDSLLTRVQASHVSRRWRAVSLDDPRLWNRFSLGDFPTYGRDSISTAAQQLSTMLQRSRPLLFHVRIPHGQDEPEIIEILRLDLHRLATYDGTIDTFGELNPERLPLPNMTSLCFLDHYNREFNDVVILPSWLPRCLPNLLELTGPDLVPPPSCEPFVALETLSYYLSFRADRHDPISSWCPNLITLELLNADTAEDTLFEPLPQSLSELIVRASYFPPSFRPTARFATILSIPDLKHLYFVFLDGAVSLERPLDRLLSLHDCHIGAILPSQRRMVRFMSRPDGAFVWDIKVCNPPGNSFLRPLETVGGTRITFIAVAMVQLIDFLTHKLTLPGLNEMRFLLNGSLGNALPPDSEERCHVHAPRLQDLVLELDGPHDKIRSNMGDIHSLLGLLRRSFRTLIVYDAELLDAVTLLSPEIFVSELDCESLAQFAKEYIVDTEE